MNSNKERFPCLGKQIFWMGIRFGIVIGIISGIILTGVLKWLFMR